MLCGDIGGTHANLAIADINDQITLKDVTQETTRNYSDFSTLINQYLEKTPSTPTRACFAIAGPILNQRVEMSNTNLVIDAKEIIAKTPLKEVVLINDFEAIGYATNILEPSDQIILNAGTAKASGVKSVIGAGTGLGKSTLIFDVKKEAYIPYPSEGGHADFPITNEEELKIAKCINKKDHLVYEDILSGRGLEALYHYFSGKELSAKQISEKRHEDPLCKKTFHYFVQFYARCAKNFVLDTLSLDGIYIAGGIAASNHDQFNQAFMEEFTTHTSPHYKQILQNTPVHLIKNYTISLKGAAFTSCL